MPRRPIAYSLVESAKPTKRDPEAYLRDALERIADHPFAGMTLPRCVNAAGAAPPEDCGGVPGYADFEQAIANPHHPEHADRVEWIGRNDWDPAVFDSSAVNDRLDSINV